MFGVETITFCPIDTAPITVSLLGDQELRLAERAIIWKCATSCPRNWPGQNLEWLLAATEPLAR